MLAPGRLGRRWDNVKNYRRWLDELVCVDIIERKVQSALSPWATGKRNKEMALLVQHDLVAGLEAMSMALFTRFLGWEAQIVKEFLARVQGDIKNTKIHACVNNLHIYARKPLENS